MPKCPELKRLTKAPRFKSVNFRAQTPGSMSQLLSHRWQRCNFLDPSHPATALPKKDFKQVDVHAFRLDAYPMALLGPPANVWEFTRPIDTWADRISRMGTVSVENNSIQSFPRIPPALLNNQKPYRIPMSFVCATIMKLSKKKVVRAKLTSQLKTAINFIVVRGADSFEDANGRRKLVLNEQEATEKGDMWILRGWTYIFHPTLELYSMPLPDLIPLMRKALRTIWDQGMELEKQWEDQALRDRHRNGSRSSNAITITGN